MTELILQIAVGLLCIFVGPYWFLSIQKAIRNDKSKRYLFKYYVYAISVFVVGVFLIIQGLIGLSLL